MNSQLLMIEFHDATFNQVSISQSFSVCISFSDLMCYYATSEINVAEVWTYAAEVQIDEMKRVTISSPVHPATWVADFEFETSDNDPIDPYNLALLNGKGLKSARLLLEGDASIFIEGGVAKVVLGKRLKMLERIDWPGGN